MPTNPRRGTKEYDEMDRHTLVGMNNKQYDDRIKLRGKQARAHAAKGNTLRAKLFEQAKMNAAEEANKYSSAALTKSQKYR